MNFATNGALTIGTLDGANVEIREEAGPENFFLFGLTAEEGDDLKSRGYHARDFYEGNNQLKGVIDLISSGHFSSEDSELFKPLVDSLLYHDEDPQFADYQSYVDCQDRVSETYAIKTHGHGCLSSMQLEWESFHPIGRFDSIAMKSGR